MAADAGVSGGVKGVEKSAGNEGLGPYHGWRGYWEPLGDAADGETDELGGDDEEPLV